MVNFEALEKARMLEEQYERTWGQKVDYTITPNGITQEDLVPVLEIMINTGDSLFVAYHKYMASR